MSQLNGNGIPTNKTYGQVGDIYTEGAVANAPWGAINATITYDYTGE